MFHKEDAAVSLSVMSYKEGFFSYEFDHDFNNPKLSISYPTQTMPEVDITGKMSDIIEDYITIA